MPISHRRLTKEQTEYNLNTRARAASQNGWGLPGELIATPIPVPEGCSPVGIICEDAYLVASLKEVEALARRMRAAGHRGTTPVILEGITIRLMTSGRIQISSGNVWSDQPGNRLADKPE